MSTETQLEQLRDRLKLGEALAEVGRARRLAQDVDHISKLVADARDHGMPMHEIGALLGVSREHVHRHYVND